MKSFLILLFWILAIKFSYGQSYSGSFTCNVDGREWSGKCIAADYNISNDLLNMSFQRDTNFAVRDDKNKMIDSGSVIEIKIKWVKTEILRYMPFVDKYEIDYVDYKEEKNYLFVTYFPDKGKNPESCYKIMSGNMDVEQVDPDAGTVFLKIDALCGLAKASINAIQDASKKIVITNGVTNDLRFSSK